MKTCNLKSKRNYLKDKLLFEGDIIDFLLTEDAGTIAESNKLQGS